MAANEDLATNEVLRARPLMWLALLLITSGRLLGASDADHPLERAALMGDAELTRVLLAERQSQYVRESALGFAIQEGHREVIDLLIDGGAHDALVMAAEKGDAELVSYLLANVPSPLAETQLYRQRSDRGIWR